MALHLAPEPIDGRKIISSVLDDLLPPPSALKQFFSKGASKRSTTRPIPVFSLLAEPGAPPAATARHVGWRYIVRADGELVTVDLAGPSPDALHPNAMRRGRSAERLALALEVAEAIARDNLDRDLRLAVMPELRLEALWLAGSEADIFIRLRSPTPLPIERFDIAAEARDLLEQRERSPRAPQEDRGG